jgi:hypothetical protein
VAVIIDALTAAGQSMSQGVAGGGAARRAT